MSTAVEVRLAPYSTLRHDHVRHIVETFIRENFTKIAVGGVEVDGWREVRILEENCESIVAAETRPSALPWTLRLSYTQLMPAITCRFYPSCVSFSARHALSAAINAAAPNARLPALTGHLARGVYRQSRRG